MFSKGASDKKSLPEGWVCPGGWGLGTRLSCRYIIIPLVTNFPGICAFIIGFSSTVWTKKSAKTIRKQVRGCLQNLYQSVAIHLKYVLLVLL